MSVRAALLAITVVLGVVPGCSPAHRRTSPSVHASEADASLPLVISREPWEFNSSQGSLTRTHSHRIFSTAVDPALDAHLPAFLEHSLERYTSEFGPLPRPPLKLDTFIMGDRNQWVQLTRQLMGSEAPTYLRIERGGFSSGGRAILWFIGRRDTFAIAAHEGWHQYTQRTFRSELPAWLEEGIALYMEGFYFDAADHGKPVAAAWANLERFDQLKKAHDTAILLPLSSVLASTPQDLIHSSTNAALTWYAQVWALTHFLNEANGGAYRRGLELLLADAAGSSLEAAARSRLPHHPRRSPLTPDLIFAAYFGSPALVEAHYAAFIRRIVEHDRAAISAGLSPARRSPDTTTR